MKNILVAILLIVSGKVMAATITVASIVELQTAIENVKPGDVIVVKDGVYTTTADINIAKAGTEKLPITIAAQTKSK